MKNPINQLSILILIGIMYAPDNFAQKTDSLVVDSLIIDTTVTETPKFTGIDSKVIAELNEFKEMHISYYGTTQNCKPFNIYSFKYRWTWFFIANQDNNVTFFVVKPPRLKTKEITPGSEFLLTGIGKSHNLSYTKLKKRRKIVKDLEVYGFYKFHKPGRKAIKGLLLLEYPKDIGPSWPFKWLTDQAQGAVKDAEGIIPEMSTKPIEAPPVEIPSIEIPEIKTPAY